jgi:predicted transcriptional regulator
MSDVSIKEEARRIIEGLPPNATWEDLQYEIFVRQKIEAGLADSREGRIVSQAEVRGRFGQPNVE